MEETNIPPLQEQLSKARTFHSFGFDCHEEYRNLSDEEYRAELEAKRDEITSYILERCRTKRRNLYIVAPVAENVAAKFEICRLCDKDRRNRVGNRFVADLMDELLRKGWLVSTQTSCGEGIRTATNKERGARQPVTQVDGQITMGCQEKRPDPSPKRKKPPAPAGRTRFCGPGAVFLNCSHWCLCFICLRFFGGVGNSFFYAFRLY